MLTLFMNRLWTLHHSRETKDVILQQNWVYCRWLPSRTHGKEPGSPSYHVHKKEEAPAQPWERKSFEAIPSQKHKVSKKLSARKDQKKRKEWQTTKDATKWDPDDSHGGRAEQKYRKDRAELRVYVPNKCNTNKRQKIDPECTLNTRKHRMHQKQEPKPKEPFGTNCGNLFLCKGPNNKCIAIVCCLLPYLSRFSLLKEQLTAPFDFFFFPL